MRAQELGMNCSPTPMKRECIGHNRKVLLEVVPLIGTNIGGEQDGIDEHRTVKANACFSLASTFRVPHVCMGRAMP
jgi:hypothetical protein